MLSSTPLAAASALAVTILSTPCHQAVKHDADTSLHSSSLFFYTIMQKLNLKHLGLIALLTSGLAQAQTQTELPAMLAGHAFIPAPSFITSPADASANLRFSGKFTTGSRVDWKASTVALGFSIQLVIN